MIKSWADHCSSDEEDSVHDDHVAQEIAEEAAAKLGVDDAAVPVHSDEVVPSDGGGPPPAKTYDFPSQPPFTAFVGNLSYQINENPLLVEAVQNLADERLEQPVKILGGRIAYHRQNNNGNHRGFGYVEVETLDQVSTLCAKALAQDGFANLPFPHAILFLFAFCYSSSSS